jgi:hypothetical protein
MVGKDAENFIPEEIKPMEFSEWIKIGIEQGWCGPPVCYTHDGLPTSEIEDEEFEEGDPCIHIIRMYESEENRIAVEDAHSPSQWRDIYTR